MRVHAIDAAEGDCLLLEDGGRFALIDGGIAGVCEKRLMPHLINLPGGPKKLEAVIVSHVDRDHITGILDLFAEVERARADGEGYTPRWLWVSMSPGVTKRPLTSTRAARSSAGGSPSPRIQR